MFYKRLKLNLIELSVVDSTNNYAANLLKQKKAANGTTILTKRQLLGRGQRGNGWVSESDKNLIQSTVVLLDLPVGKSFYLNIAVGLAINKVLLDLGLCSKIKWPNDIYCGDAKIAGVLNETQVQSNVIKSVIIGIGLNVNQTSFDAHLNATSIKKETGKSADLKTIFFALYKQLDFYLDHLMQQNYALLLKLYYKNMYRFECLSNYSDDTGAFSGSIKGVNEQGHLLIDQSGVIKAYDLKEIKFEF